MEKLSSPRITKEIINKYGFNFSKSLGQNFLIDGNVVSKIVDVSDITKEDYIIEIGPGIGTLTQELCEKAKKVIAVEIDSKLIPILSENLKDYENIEIIHNDILRVDINELINEKCEGKKVKVVANLPYYITTPIIMELLERKLNISSITVMIQKEVAERINAKPSNKEYGAISVAVQYYATPKNCFVVSSTCFMPQPKVDSIVIRLDILENPSVQVKNSQLFFSVIKASFSQRRKTLINGLYNSGLFNKNKEELKEILNKIGINENQRGETLSLEQFARLSDALQ